MLNTPETRGKPRKARLEARVSSSQMDFFQRAATVARMVYHGVYQGLPGAWNELMQWIADNGHTPALN
ncbi:MAG: hypothetical protein KGL51_10075 [Betaproteobacteria bacterium]|nr:hypothetical protein [Betaproteobacteria bacterium]MDE2124328.1 hypothetical protein [Betaproteobacteria bacterium]MDE2186205.1 hypothetical protein [Betaproteobacteria bacterium]MDE2324999.1 hypothetical protein [Betaproteobacteria bacterium]